MRCKAQGAPFGQPNKRLATQQRTQIRRGKWGSYFSPHPTWAFDSQNRQRAKRMEGALAFDPPALACTALKFNAK